MNADVEIVTMKITDINRAAYNPRHMNDEMRGRLDKSVEEFGIVELPVVNKRNNTCVGGHQRLTSFENKGITETPVVLVDLDDEKERALNLALNKIDGEWDQDMLMKLLSEFDSIDFDLTGFGDVEVSELLAIYEAKNKTPLTGEDEVPDVESLLVSRPDDLFALGNHGLICGDATDVETFEALMCGDLADMVFTDPPYNVDYQSSAGKIQNDKMSPKEFREFLDALFATVATFMRPGAAIYVAHSDTERVSFQRAMEKADIKIASCLIWNKNQLVMSRADYHWKHEPILYGWKKGAAHSWHGNRKHSTVRDILDAGLFDQVDDNTVHLFIGDRVIEVKGEGITATELTGTVISIDKPQRSKEHPTMKPVALIEPCMLNSSRAGQIVVDCCGGSGSTLITAEKTGRVARLSELDPKYVDVIIRRWQNYTGEQAVRSDGVLFDEITPRKAA